jgi:hypothetical protein
MPGKTVEVGKEDEFDMVREGERVTHERGVSGM